MNSLAVRSQPKTFSVPTLLPFPVLTEQQALTCPLPSCTCHLYYQFHSCGCEDKTSNNRRVSIPVPFDPGNGNPILPPQPFPAFLPRGVYHTPSVQRCSILYQPLRIRIILSNRGFRHIPDDQLPIDTVHPHILPNPCLRHTFQCRVTRRPSETVRFLMEKREYSRQAFARRQSDARRVQKKSRTKTWARKQIRTLAPTPRNGGGGEGPIAWRTRSRTAAAAAPVSPTGTFRLYRHRQSVNLNASQRRLLQHRLAAPLRKYSFGNKEWYKQERATYLWQPENQERTMYEVGSWSEDTDYLMLVAAHNWAKRGLTLEQVEKVAVRDPWQLSM